MANHFYKARSLFQTTLSADIGTGTGSTITLNSTVGLPTDTYVTLTFDRIASDGVTLTPDSMERIRGLVDGNTIINYTRATEGEEQEHLEGCIVECVFNGSDWNDSIDGFLVGHNQDGTHKGNALSFTPEGAYVAETTYDINDIVSYEGGSYIAIAETTGNLPTDTDYWFQISSKGDTGDQGLQGIQGVAGAYQQVTSVVSYDTDGFTLTWGKTGSPTGTVTVAVLCLR